MEHEKFNRDDNRERGDNRDRTNDQDRGSGGGFNRDRPNDRDRGSGGGFNRDRSNDRDRGSGGFNRDRPNDRDRGSGGGFNRDRGSGGGFNRDRPNDRDRSSGGGFNRGGGDRSGGGGFNRDNRESREEEESVFSKRVRAGKRRTYFFDVKKTKGEDYFITITESTRREDGFGYKRHKLFLYKEDFNRFVASLNEVVEHVKTDLMPDFDYEEFDRRQAEWEAQNRDTEDGEERTSSFGRNEAEDDGDGEERISGFTRNKVDKAEPADEVKAEEKEKDEDDVEW